MRASSRIRRSSPSKLCNGDRTHKCCFTLCVLFCFVWHAQCSQRSGGLLRALDGTAKHGPHPSRKPQDGRHCGGRWALQGQINWRGGLQGTAGDYGRLPGTAGDYGALCMNPIERVSLYPPRAVTEIH